MTPISKKKVIIPIVAVVLVAGITAAAIVSINVIRKNRAIEEYYVSVDAYNKSIGNYNSSVSEYNKIVNEINDINASYIKEINDAQYIIDKGGKPFEEKYMENARNVLMSCANVKINRIEETGEKNTIVYDSNINNYSVDEINNITATINDDTTVIAADQASLLEQKSMLVVPDYAEKIDNLKTVTKDLIHSYSIQRHITNPDQKIIIERLSAVDEIANIAPSTLDNDPNNGMSSENGYKVQIYFSTPLLSASEKLSGDELIKAGTSAGGSIEVYRTNAEASDRDKYLTCTEYFLGKDTGYHTVLGSMVIRLSSKLSGTNEKKLLDSIIPALRRPELYSYDEFVETEPEVPQPASHDIRQLDVKFKVPNEFDDIYSNFRGSVSMIYKGDYRTDDGNDMALIYIGTYENDFGFSMTYYNNNYFRKKMLKQIRESYLKNCKADKNYTIPFANAKAIAQRGTAEFNSQPVNYIAVFSFFPDINEYTVSLMIYRCYSPQGSRFPDIYEEMLSKATTNAMKNTTDENNSDQIPTDVVSDDFKKQLDDYEDFSSKYVEFMNKYTASSDVVSLYSEYRNMLSHYVYIMREIENIDVESLSKADYMYYLDVLPRVYTTLYKAPL